jgi:serine/threonine protein phosphatase PrpC/predicted Ser/Thr protein kinase
MLKLPPSDLFKVSDFSERGICMIPELNSEQKPEQSTSLKVSIGQCSDKGRKDSNQDFHGSYIPKNSLLSIKGIAIAMADGISSSEFSHIASETAVKTFIDDYYCTSEAWTVKNSVERVLKSVNSWLYSQTMKGPGRYDKDKGYVTTLSAVVIKNHSAHIFHIGDTRVYRLNNNGLEQLTNDHRLWASEGNSYLSRALGIDDQYNVDHQSVTIKKDDLFILCTDGIHEHLPAKDIVQIIKTHPDDFNTAAQAIVTQALENGSDDNLSIQLVRINELAENTALNIQQQVETLPFPPILSARMEFDGYTILRTLHTSSRSHVYLAQDNQSQKQVVIKAPAIDIKNDAEHLERFLMESWVARRINNAHVLKADLAERPKNYIYTVFEFIEGQTLAQWAIDNPKPELEVVRGLVEQLAKGLNALHKMDMLHQDIRPENIMIDTQGTLKIIDFGSVSIAGIQEARRDLPHTYLQGTALYSAPEYFLGEQGTLQSEIFSLGVITYYLLSGHYPYDARVARTKTISEQRKLVYKTLLTEDREIPSWVDDAIRKGTAPLPDRRYDSLFEYLHDLRKPNAEFLNKPRPALIERNPLALWQGVSFALAMIIIYLLITTNG